MVRHVEPSPDPAFAVISDPPRRAVVDALRQRPVSAGEIARRFSIPTMSLNGGNDGD